MAIEEEVVGHQQLAGEAAPVINITLFVGTHLTSVLILENVAAHSNNELCSLCVSGWIYLSACRLRKNELTFHL